MEYVFTYIAAAFGIMLLLYGLDLFITGNIKDLPYRRRYVAKMNDRKAYVRQIGKFVMIISCAPLLSAAVGFITGAYTVAAIVFFVSLVAAIIICVKTYKVL